MQEQLNYHLTAWEAAYSCGLEKEADRHLNKSWSIYEFHSRVKSPSIFNIIVGHFLLKRGPFPYLVCIV